MRPQRRGSGGPVPRPWLLVLVAAALAAGWAGPAAAAEALGEVRVRLGLGHDSNALRLHDAGPDGGYAELNVVGAMGRPINRKLRWFVDGNADGRRYESGLSDADALTGGLRAGLAATPNPFAYRRLTVAFGALYNVSRSTFVDRETGRVYEVTGNPLTDPPTTVAIPDRFDADSLGAFVELNWKVQERLRLFLNTSLEEARYRESYDAGTFLHPLDYRARTLEPGLFLRVHRIVGVGLSAVLSDLEYDENPALDESGFEIPGTRRHYEYSDLRFSLRVAPAKRLNLEIGVRGGTRDDTYAGYYDFASQVRYLSIDAEPGRRSRLQLFASRRDLDYGNAVVPGSPDGEFRASDVTRLVGRYEWRFGEHLGLFGEGGAQTTDNSDPLYAYDRSWVLTGMTFRR